MLQQKQINQKNEESSQEKIEEEEPAVTENEKDGNTDGQEKDAAEDLSGGEEENADEMNGWVNGKRDPDYSVMKEKYYYTVKKGDTLASISQKMYHGMNGIKNIKEANGIEDEDMILVGQVLVIP